MLYSLRDRIQTASHNHTTPSVRMYLHPKPAHRDTSTSPRRTPYNWPGRLGPCRSGDNHCRRRCRSSLQDNSILQCDTMGIQSCWMVIKTFVSKKKSTWKEGRTLEKDFLNRYASLYNELHLLLIQNVTLEGITSGGISNANVYLSLNTSIVQTGFLIFYTAMAIFWRKFSHLKDRMFSMTRKVFEKLI